MIRSPDELTQPIKEAVNRRAVVLSHTILAITIAGHTYLQPGVPQYQRITSVVISIGVIGLIFFRFFDLARVNSRPRTYLIAYSIIIFIGYAFISDAATPYTVGVFLLAYLFNLYYGSKGVIFTIYFFIFTSIVKYFYLQSTIGLTLTDKLNIVVAVAVFFAIASLFINIQKVFDWDRARLKDTTRIAVIEQKRLRALVNNMTESVVVLDKEGLIRLYNAAALALFNTNVSLSDKPLDSIVRFEDEKGNLIKSFDLMPKNARPIMRTDVMLRYATEDTAALSLVVTPIRSTYGQDKEEEGYVMTLRDITREKSLEDERNEFISVISHELRTPVTTAEAGVSNAIMLVEKNADTEKVKHTLKIAHDQSVFLANILNRLTTFARAEDEPIKLTLEKLDPRELIDSLKKDYQGIIEDKNMTIATHKDDSTPEFITSNRLYIREILQNFITNAIKYSDKGTVTLSVKGRPKGVLFSVTDQGIGISVSDQKKTFQKFFRAEDYRTRSTGGMGLGLYITKKLAKVLHASFEIQSEVGKGSTFSVFVPDMTEIKKADQDSAGPPRGQAEPAKAAPEPAEN
jgi:two-component system, OmpR family, phosphate regulon sensor histidine kinase PhoR